MKGKHIRLIREHANISQAAMAEILQVTQRTIAKWESEEEISLSSAYSAICRIAFENLLLAPLLKHAAQQVFEKIPAECIKIWLVRHSLFPMQYADTIEESSSVQRFWEVVLHENTTRYQCLYKTSDEKYTCRWEQEFCESDHCYQNDRIHINMEKQLSLVTFPLRKGESLNLTGNAIATHTYRGTRGLNRANALYHDQLCHSLLHVPYFIFGGSAPQPVALLFIDNKLEEDGLKFTDVSLQHLRHETISADLLECLADLQEKIVTQEELWHAIRQQPGRELSHQDKQIIVKHALKRWKVKTFPEGGVGEAFSQADKKMAKELIKEIYEGQLKEIVSAFDYLP
jgi:transcriptional regulator with XRE-family HTH domain